MIDFKRILLLSFLMTSHSMFGAAAGSKEDRMYQEALAIARQAAGYNEPDDFISIKRDEFTEKYGAQSGKIFNRALVDVLNAPPAAQAGPAKPAAAKPQKKQEGEDLTQYLSQEIVQKMSQNLKNDLIQFVKVQRQVRTDEATIKALLKADPEVKALVGKAATEKPKVQPIDVNHKQEPAAGVEYPRIPTRKEILATLDNIIALVPAFEKRSEHEKRQLVAPLQNVILKEFPQDMIEKRLSAFKDREFFMQLLREAMNGLKLEIVLLDFDAMAKVSKALDEFLKKIQPADAKPPREGQRGAAGARIQIKEPKVVFLPKYTQGGACTYNMISDARDIVKALRANGTATPADLPNQCDPKLMQEARKFMNEFDALAPDFNEHIIPLMKQINFMDGKDYTVITTDAVNNPARGKELAESFDAVNIGDYPTVAASIQALKTQHQTMQVFLVGTGGHWFVVVADKRAGAITLYVSDRDMKQMGDNNKAAVLVIKNLLA